MEIGLYEAVSGMKAQSAYEDMISANLSRSSVPGNKKVQVAFEIPPESELEKQSEVGGTTQTLGLHAAPLQARSVIDFTPGLINPTGNPTDFAIDGDGFFKVRQANGDISYTRDGQFHLDRNGILTTANGGQLLTDKDTPISINLKEGTQFSVTPNGKVIAGPNNSTRGTLAIVRMDDPRTALVQGQDGGFNLGDGVSDAGFQTGVGKNTFIRQGFREASNADSVSEMVGLVQVVRSYEANQKSLQSQDSVTGEMIQAAGSTS